MAEREKKEQIHKNHRERLKKRFLDEGLDGFTDFQALELMLFYCIPRRDTNEIAHELMEKFGSLSAVLDARVEDLMKIDYISLNAATYLKMLPQVARRYMVDSANQKKVLRTIDECGDYLMSHYIGRQHETVFVLCLDAGCQVICCREVGEGDINSAGVSIRKIVELALSVKASSLVLAHNHPSGIALPSVEDVQVTRRVAAALDGVDVILTDHIIVANDDYVSLAQSGLYRYEDCRLEV